MPRPMRGIFGFPAEGVISLFGGHDVEGDVNDFHGSSSDVLEQLSLEVRALRHKTLSLSGIVKSDLRPLTGLIEVAHDWPMARRSGLFRTALSLHSKCQVQLAIQAEMENALESMDFDEMRCLLENAENLGFAHLHLVRAMQQHVENCDAPESSLALTRHHISKRQRSSNNIANPSDLTGFEVMTITGDGNCLFRAVAKMIYGDQEAHELVRSECCDFMIRHQPNFEPFITDDEPFAQYIDDLRRPAVWGGETEIAALSTLYQRDIWIYHEPSLELIYPSPLQPLERRFPFDEPIRLTYNGGVEKSFGTHYQVLVARPRLK